jgi:hypothetical protein
MKCNEVMTHILFDTIPNWMKYHHEKDFRIVRKVIIYIKTNVLYI